MRASDGTIAVLFGLSLAVFLIAIGIALDSACALNVQTKLQADLNAAVLSIAARSRNEESNSIDLGCRGDAELVESFVRIAEHFSALRIS